MIKWGLESPGQVSNSEKDSYSLFNIFASSFKKENISWLIPCGRSYPLKILLTQKKNYEYYVDKMLWLRCTECRYNELETLVVWPENKNDSTFYRFAVAENITRFQLINLLPN